MVIQAQHAVIAKLPLQKKFSKQPARNGKQFAKRTLDGYFGDFLLYFYSNKSFCTSCHNKHKNCVDTRFSFPDPNAFRKRKSKGTEGIINKEPEASPEAEVGAVTDSNVNSTETIVPKPAESELLTDSVVSTAAIQIKTTDPIINNNSNNVSDKDNGDDNGNNNGGENVSDKDNGNENDNGSSNGDDNVSTKHNESTADSSAITPLNTPTNATLLHSLTETEDPHGFLKYLPDVAVSVAHAVHASSSDKTFQWFARTGTVKVSSDYVYMFTVTLCIGKDCKSDHAADKHGDEKDHAETALKHCYASKKDIESYLALSGLLFT